MELMEQILSDSNIALAQIRVIGNKGASGIDKVSVEELRAYMSSNWSDIKSSILSRSYRPLPVRRVEIPKEQGGVRKLGIPTVVDRTIQQAIAQASPQSLRKSFFRKVTASAPSGAVIRGWINYFSLSDMKVKTERIDEHLRTMLRVVIWKQ